MHIFINRNLAKKNKKYRDAIRKNNAVKFFFLLNIYIVGILLCVIYGEVAYAFAFIAVMLFMIIGSAALVMENPIATMIGYVRLYTKGFYVAKSWIKTTWTCL